MTKATAKPLATYPKLLSQILKEINGLKTKEERIAALKSTQDILALNDILALQFNEHIVRLLPDTAPPYTPADPKSHPMNLTSEIRNLHYFVDSPGSQGVKEFRRQKIFIDMLEGIHPDDAKLLVAIFTNSWPYKRITRDIIEAAKPGVLAVPRHKRPKG